MTKAFDAVEFMRKRRAQIDDEDRGLSWGDKARKTLDLLRDNPLWKHVRSRVAEPGRGFAAAKESSPPKLKETEARKHRKRG